MTFLLSTKSSVLYGTAPLGESSEVSLGTAQRCSVTPYSGTACLRTGCPVTAAFAAPACGAEQERVRRSTTLPAREQPVLLLWETLRPKQGCRAPLASQQ